jgi:hypothetical protein
MKVQRAFALRGALLGLCLAALWLAGCGPVTQFKFGDKTYTDVDQANQARRQALDKVLSEIPPSSQPPLKARVLVALPDRKILLDRGVKVTGDKSALPLEAYTYLVQHQEADYDCMVEALRRRQIFTAVTSRRSDWPEGLTDPEAEAVLSLSLKSPDQGDWLFRTMPEGAPRHIEYDRSLPKGSQQTIAWLEAIEKMARNQLQERGKIR